MPDPDARIRARLDRDGEIEDFGDAWEDYDAARRALLNVLDLHKPRGTTVAAKVVYDCEYCRDTNWGGPDVPWPCETVEAIAKGLGIEVDGG